jgi:hypothetical protein
MAAQYEAKGMEDNNLKGWGGLLSNSIFTFPLHMDYNI